jgi:hypothetical protein
MNLITLLRVSLMKKYHEEYAYLMIWAAIQSAIQMLAIQ